MDLSAKIARLCSTPPPKVDLLRSEIARIMERPPAPREPKRARLGSRRETDHGAIWHSQSYLDPLHVHGRVPIAKALAAESHLVAELALDPALESVDLSRALYLDTETTGLRGGTGTVAFLIGLGWFEDQSFSVEQLFLDELGEEGPMLEWVKRRVEAATAIVTFNGKAFDWPLLESRYVINRVNPPAVRPHVDLLHCARRIYRRRLGGVRLADVEERVLGMRRERDISGAEIPGLYWSFLRHKNTDSLAPVAEHNANDLVALAAMLGHLSERFARVYAEDEPVDHLARAKLAFRAEDPARAIRFALAASEGGGDRAITIEAHVLLAAIAKCARDLEAHERHLLVALEAAAERETSSAPIHFELAKLYEHKSRDYVRALEHARHTLLVEGAEDHAKRVARIERKATRGPTAALGRDVV